MFMVNPEWEHKKVYGGALSARLEYVKEVNGPDALKKLYKRMLDAGFDGPANPRDIKIRLIYPVKNMIIFLREYQEMFGKEELFELSRQAPRRKGIVGWLVRWAGSPDMLMRKAQEYWPNFYTYGSIEGRVKDGNKGVLKGTDVCLDPLFCDSLTYYFKGVMENAVNDVTCEHTSCQCRGDAKGTWELTWGK